MEQQSLVDDIPLSVIQEFVDEFRDPSKKGATGKGNKILFQATVVSYDSATNKVTVTYDGTEMSLSVFMNYTYIAGDVVWGIQDGNVKIIIGRVGVPAWNNVSFLNSWVNFGGSYANVQYRKEPNGVVRIRGSAKNGSMGNYVFNLPAGFRPPLNLVFPIYSNGVFCYLLVLNNGDVFVGATPGSSNAQICLDNVSFSTI